MAGLIAIGCTSKAGPSSPEGLAFKKEVGPIIRQMQQTLARPVAQNDVPAINAALDNLSQKTAGICIDCPYKMAIINKEGTLLTTYPNNEFIGRNFSSYKIFSEPLEQRRIAQSEAYQADGAKIYFISAPLLYNGKIPGVVVLALTPADIEKKWHLNEKEFLKLNFNTPENHE